MKKIFFTPGPSQLYFTVEEHLKTALKENIGAISHRSQVFMSIYKAVDEGLRTLLNLPDNFTVIFTGSATEIWERLLTGCVQEKSLHLVNGAFSNKFYQTAELLGFTPHKLEAEFGSCSLLANQTIEVEPELISFTHNETSTGASHPLEDIYKTREKYPNALITVDAVSSLPFVNIDYSKVDAVYFSVQKCFGLPAGLGVVLVNERCMEAAERKAAASQSTGSTLSLPSSYTMAKNFQTPSTPNVLNIYLLGKVLQDMNLKGIDMIRRETAYKAALLYHTLKDHPHFAPFVKEPAFQSKTTVVAKVADSKEIIAQLSGKGLVVGSGYGKFKNNHIRIANFPTHSKEQIELLVDHINALKG